MSRIISGHAYNIVKRIMSKISATEKSRFKYKLNKKQ